MENLDLSFEDMSVEEILSLTPTAIEVGSLGAGLKGCWEMVKGYGYMTASVLATDSDKKQELLKKVHESHAKGVTWLTVSAIATGIASGNWSYAIMQPGFCLTTLKKYYESHPEELEKLPFDIQGPIKFVIDNWGLKSSIGLNALLVAAAMGITSGGITTLVQVLGAATISIGLETIGKFGGNFGIAKSQSLMLAGRISMLVTAALTMTVAPTGATAAWLVLMTWASYRNSIDLTKSLIAGVEKSKKEKVRN